MLPDISAIHHQIKMQSIKHKSLFTVFVLKGPLKNQHAAPNKHFSAHVKDLTQILEHE